MALISNPQQALRLHRSSTTIPSFQISTSLQLQTPLRLQNHPPPHLQPRRRSSQQSQSRSHCHRSPRRRSSQQSQSRFHCQSLPDCRRNQLRFKFHSRDQLWRRKHLQTRYNLTCAKHIFPPTRPCKGIIPCTCTVIKFRFLKIFSDFGIDFLRMIRDNSSNEISSHKEEI